jgi:hypothetical protein
MAQLQTQTAKMTTITVTPTRRMASTPQTATVTPQLGSLQWGLLVKAVLQAVVAAA